MHYQSILSVHNLYNRYYQSILDSEFLFLATTMITTWMTKCLSLCEQVVSHDPAPYLVSSTVYC